MENNLLNYIDDTNIKFYNIIFIKEPMMNYRRVIVTFDVYVPEMICDQSDSSKLEQYLNDRLNQDPEFYGEVDYGMITLTDEMLEQ